MKLADTLTGALVALLGVAVFLYARTFPPMPGQPVGPSLFPSIVGVALAALGVVLALSGRHRPPAAAADEPGWISRPRMVANFAVVIGTLLFYAAIVNTLGFIPTAALFLSMLMLAFGVRRARILPLAVLIAVAVHFGFYTLLRVPLPWGMLEGVAW
jgi:putative tricarboxylic transport membrane protein